MKKIFVTSELNDDWIRNLPDYDDDVISQEALGIYKTKQLDKELDKWEQDTTTIWQGLIDKGLKPPVKIRLKSIPNDMPITSGGVAGRRNGRKGIKLHISGKNRPGAVSRLKGGPGSGDFGHRGRPGQVGGSAGTGSEGRLTVTITEIGRRRSARRANANQGGNIAFMAKHQRIGNYLKTNDIQNLKEINGGTSKTYTGTIAGVGIVVEKPVSELYYYHADYIDIMYQSHTNGSEFPVAAGDIAANFGWDEVPTSEIFESESGEKTLRSVFVENTTLYDNAIDLAQQDFKYSESTEQSMERIAVVDHLIGQQDGHGYNYVVNNATGKVYGIDYNIAGFAKPRENIVSQDYLYMAHKSKNTQLKKPVAMPEMMKNSRSTAVTATFAKSLLNVGKLNFSSSVPQELQDTLNARFTKLKSYIRDSKNYSNYGGEDLFFMPYHQE